MDPIYQQMAAARLWPPDPPRGVEDRHQLRAVTPAAALLERIDGWCEDRPRDALSDEDGHD